MKRKKEEADGNIAVTGSGWPITKAAGGKAGVFVTGGFRFDVGG